MLTQTRIHALSHREDRGQEQGGHRPTVAQHQPSGLSLVSVPPSPPGLLFTLPSDFRRDAAGLASVFRPPSSALRLAFSPSYLPTFLLPTGGRPRAGRRLLSLDPARRGKSHLIPIPAGSFVLSGGVWVVAARPKASRRPCRWRVGQPSASSEDCACRCHPHYEIPTRNRYYVRGILGNAGAAYGMTVRRSDGLTAFPDRRRHQRCSMKSGEYLWRKVSIFGKV
jgi:hypothetical protein